MSRISDWDTVSTAQSDSGISLPEKTVIKTARRVYVRELHTQQSPVSDSAADGSELASSRPCCPWERNHSFYFSLITFRVENQLFRVPREGFERNSEFFNHLSCESRSTSGPHEGDSDDSPLYLEGVTSEAFEDLLQLLYPQQPTKSPSELQLSKDRWIGILELAHKWKFNSIRDFAISKLEAFHFDEVSKVELAHRYEIKKWYMPAYVDLARRQDPLSVDEAERLGFPFAVEMAHIRELRLRRGIRHVDPDDMMLKVDISVYLGAEDEAT